MPKTLVTGATGFLGSALVRQLIEVGVDVCVLRRSQSKLDLLGPVSDQVEHRIGDVTDPESVQALATRSSRYSRKVSLKREPDAMDCLRGTPINIARMHTGPKKSVKNVARDRNLDDTSVLYCSF